MLKADKAGLFSSRAYAIVMEGLGSACFLSIGVTRPMRPEARALGPERVDPRSLRLGFLIIQIESYALRRCGTPRRPSVC